MADTVDDKPHIPNAPAPVRVFQTKYPGLLDRANSSNIKYDSSKRKSKKRIGTILEKVLSYACREDLTLLGLDASGIPDEDREQLTNEDIIAMQIIAKAVRGDLAAAQMIYDRTEGKPVQVNHNVNAEITYTEYLERLADEEKEAVVELLS